MVNYKLTEKAADDFAAIFEFGILNFGLTQAEDYIEGLQERFSELVEILSFIRLSMIFVWDIAAACIAVTLFTIM